MCTRLLGSVVHAPQVHTPHHQGGTGPRELWGIHQPRCNTPTSKYSADNNSDNERMVWKMTLLCISFSFLLYKTYVALEYQSFNCLFFIYIASY